MTLTQSPVESGRDTRGGSTPTRRRPPLRYLVVTVAAVLALGGALLAPAVVSWLSNDTAKDRIEAAPPPTLFPEAVVTRIDALTDPQQARAATLMQQWWQDHGTQADDAAFRSWLEGTFPGPPSTAQRSREMAEVERLDQQRTPDGITAATWLEAFGKKDVWKLAAHDQAELLPATAGQERKDAVDAMLSLTKTVADDLGTRFGESAPYVVEPSLRTDHTVSPGDVCPCSYPSRHASAAAASRTYLGLLMPSRDADYRRWQDEIDYSRIYMAGHVSSDITGGTLLGDMVGDYFLVTRAHVPPERLGG
ncbi:MAG: hypothetical protein U0R80_05390 [Nocardioidaceae bacterium]